jgi:hypothetical protein
MNSLPHYLSLGQPTERQGLLCATETGHLLPYTCFAQRRPPAGWELATQ